MIRKVLSVFPVVVVVMAIGCAQPSASPGLDETRAFTVVYSHASVNSNMPDGTYESSGSPGTNGDPDTYTVTTTVVPSGDEIEMVGQGRVCGWWLRHAVEKPRALHRIIRIIQQPLCSAEALVAHNPSTIDCLHLFGKFDRVAFNDHIHVEREHAASFAIK